MSAGVPRYASVHDDTVVFVAEDDVWSVPRTGGLARRLTTGLGRVSHARISADGASIAFTAAQQGVREVYVIDREGGAARRLTWQGDHARVVGWSPRGEVVFASAWQRPFAKDLHLHAVSPQGGATRALGLGPAASIAWHADGRVALARFQEDLARWKRYRGGRTGVIWVGDAEGAFTRLALPGGVVNPMWVGDRLFFVGDGDGDAQLWSCTPDGDDLQRHSAHDDGFSVRFAATDGATIVYCQGTDLWRTTPDADAPERIEVDIPASCGWRRRRFVSSARFLEDVDVHPEGHSLVLITRGRPYAMGHWEGPVRQLGARDGVRYRLARWVDEDRVLVVSDAGGEEALELHPLAGDDAPARLDDLDLGRIVTLEVSPTGRHAAAANHRQELWLVDLEQGDAVQLDHSPAGRTAGLDFSPDGRWLAWASPCGLRGDRCRLRLARVDEPGSVHDVTDGHYRDVRPSFDPDGAHLYFLSHRAFAPVYDAHYFELGFPRGAQPYVVTLRRDLRNPLEPSPSPLKKKKQTRKGPPAVDIDLEDIGDRVLALPVQPGRYADVVGVGEGKVLLLRAPVKSGRRRWADQGPPPSDLQLLQWELETRELTVLNNKVSWLRVDRGRDTMAVRSGWKLRVAATRPDKRERDELRKHDGPTDRKHGFVDLRRVRVEVDQAAEWGQMLREVWRLMRDHFWSEDMAGIDWEAVYARYAAQLDRVTTRSEFSDLVWRMQGELGTSHAYEVGGEYPRVSLFRVGSLGADVSWDDDARGWRIERVVRGEPGSDACSPLLAPGVGLEAGDVITALGGRHARSDEPVEAALLHQAGVLIELEVQTRNGVRRVEVRTLRAERKLRYRDWVVQNRSRVHAQTDGRVGYLHVPDMGPDGFAAFHRDYLAESERQALIVDVRFNRGGHVSQLLLDKLSRRRVGYAVTRWSRPRPWPAHSVAGPMACITNEMAGSDGDIFSHVWKLRELGPLIGTRTWGGVVGISPRQPLVDRAVPTQPEFSNWFVDVGFGLENHGTEPDVEVPFPPSAHLVGDDPQLERAITLLVEQLDAPGDAAPEPPPRGPGSP